MTLIAVPLQPLNLTERTADLLLQGMLSVPAIFPVPGTPDERRVLIASILSDPLNRVWLVWNGGVLIGALLLTHIVPQIDAQCHFVFFDRTLYGRKALVWNLMGKVFREYGFQRLTVEIPENLPILYRFVRQKLWFRLEGEEAAGQYLLLRKGLESAREQVEEWVRKRFNKLQASSPKQSRLDAEVLHSLVAEAVRPYLKDGTAWLTRLGSRRERACWNSQTNEWMDVLRLRLLRSEYEQIAANGEGHASRSTESVSSPRYPGRASAAVGLSPQPQLLSANTGGPR
jgi:hypothetical protein